LSKTDLNNKVQKINTQKQHGLKTGNTWKTYKHNWDLKLTSTGK